MKVKIFIIGIVVIAGSILSGCGCWMGAKGASRSDSENRSMSDKSKDVEMETAQEM